MLTIYVYSQSSGKPVIHKRVHLDFGSDLFGSYLEEYTDSNGQASFNTEPRSGSVSVDGSVRYKGHLSGRINVFI